ncbi:serine hydrolase domain-containing protein [Hyalangium versicolor]|uniref:serine hydrolase domain-containing protein n=1 Tax=Hyalangium versicolor TaxID=2861190 RepID=UPI001CC9AE5A|nr:serine hydrolase [Hyalangium versicolor]
MTNTRGFFFFVVLLALLVAPASFAQPSAGDAGVASSAARLVGIWGAERHFGPEVQGTLLLTRSGDQWVARLGGFEVSGRAEKGALSLVFPGGQGELRAKLDADGKSLRGQWIQPQTVVGDARYATPIAFRALGKDAWTGDVTPWDDRFTLYLVVQQQPDGSVTAFMRNPERHFGARFAFQVSLEGKAVRFANTRQPNMSFEGTYDDASGRLTLSIAFLGPFEFTRKTRDQAVGLYPRTPAAGPYTYRAPLGDDDGWATASLADVGMDPKPITALVQRILDVEPSTSPVPIVQGLLIARHGKLVLEEYFYGFERERPHDMRSAGKSITSVLVGLALDRKAPFTVESKVYPLFPEYRALPNPDPRKEQLTVEHLLTMSSGFACDDDDENSPGNEDRMQSEPGDWYAYTLGLPMARVPGEKPVYCSAGINLLSGVVRNTLHVWLPELFESGLARPLQMQRYHLNLSPTGEMYGGGGLFLRPRDALKVGQLFLQGGVWNGKRVISKDWVERSTALHVTMEPGRTYGYAWWRQELKVGDRVYAEYEAGGNGGQLVMVVPELDLTVMFAGGNYNQVSVWRKFREEFLPQYILAAVTAPPPAKKAR